jgi:hypothetical protein
VEDSVGLLTITAVYLPLKHTVCKAQLEDFYTISGLGSSQVEITMPNILTGDPGSSHLVVVKSIKHRKATT